MRLKQLLIVSLFVAFATSVLGQGVTTSTINGRVVDTNGEPVPFAIVMALHEPSGSTYGTSTGDDGFFFIPSMRVGGPYTVRVSFMGYEEAVITNVQLSLGSATNFSVTLHETGVALEEITVKGKRSNVFSSDRTGAATTVNQELMTALPTISRSINDFTRLTPQASGRSFVGQDARYNNITIDGSIFNNSFGLADQPGGRTGSTPISLDAIQEIQVNIAPYDVRQAGFVGAGVNAVTKSGTNDFTGTAFFTNRNQSFTGKKAYGEEIVKDDFNVNQFGASVGGPVIKNKLFFFANVELERQATPATPFRANKGGEPVEGNVTRVLESDLDNLSTFLKTNFGYETGPYQGYNNETVSDKFLIKFDYNIDKNNKFSVRYNMLDSKTDVLCSNSSSLGFGNRRSNTQALNYQNSNYIQTEKIHSVIGELNSVFGKLSNNLIFGYTYQNEDRDSRGDFFPLIEIHEATTTYITAGFEPFTPKNQLNYKTFQLQNNVTYFAGKNVITGGFNIERFEFENLFFPGSQSVYVYNSLDDFYTDANDYLANPNRTTGVVPVKRFQLRYSALPGGADPIQPTKVTYAGAYIQDQFTPNTRVKITAGIRVDIPFFAETGFKNDSVAKWVFRGRGGEDYKINTDKLPDANLLISPRLGFNVDLTGDRMVQLRGGSGVFTGRPVFVWISNQIGNNGVLTGFDQLNNTQDRFFHPDPTHWIPEEATLPSSYEIAATDPTFKFPQVWRSNLAVDVKLPLDLVGTVEFVNNKEINGIGYFNANLPASSLNFEGPDNRPRYAATRINGAVVNAITLDNSNNGYGRSFAVSVEKPLSEGFFGKIAYAFGESKNTVNPGSIASGSYNNNAISWDPNNAPLTYSNDDQRHRFFTALSYRKEYAGFGATQVGVFFEGRNQGRYSYIYSTDMNGDGNRNDLLYVAKDVSEMNFQTYNVTVSGSTAAPFVYTAEEQAADWEAFIKQDEYLNSIRGKYTERNGALIPWVWQADLNITQEFFINAGGKRNTLQLAFNILNVGNLINNKWGAYWVINSTQPIRYQTADAEGKPVFRLNPLGSTVNEATNEVQITKLTETFSKRQSISDVWSAQFALRYIFN